MEQFLQQLTNGLAIGGIYALIALGYKLPEASRMVNAVDSDGLSSEAIIRLALQASVRR